MPAAGIIPDTPDRSCQFPVASRQLQRHVAYATRRCNSGAGRRLDGTLGRRGARRFPLASMLSGSGSKGGRSRFRLRSRFRRKPCRLLPPSRRDSSESPGVGIGLGRKPTWDSVPSGEPLNLHRIPTGFWPTALGCRACEATLGHRPIPVPTATRLWPR